MSVFGYGSVRVERNIFPDTMKRGTLAYTPHDHCPFIRRRNDAENLFCARHENSASAACEVSQSCIRTNQLKIKRVIPADQ